MSQPNNPISSVSDTARWVAMYRAMESERSDALFHDTYARRLAAPTGEQILASMPQGRRWAWPMIVRTAVMDEIIMRVARDEGLDTIVNLAAGLDARPYRHDLSAQPALRWWLIDLGSPALLQFLSRTWGNQLRSGNAPMRFAPEEGTAFFAPSGWREAEYRAILDEAVRLHRAPKMAWVWRLLGLFASKQRREQFKRFSGIVLLENNKGR